MESIEEYFTSTRDRLVANGYKLIHDVQLPGGLTCEFVAAKTYFSWKGFIFLSQFIFVFRADQPTKEDAERLFEAGLKYCQEGRSLPIQFRGLQAGGIIVPCLVSPSIDEPTIEYANKIPRKHWALFEFPVFHDLTTKKTHYCRKTGIWGGFFYSDFHKLVKSCLVSKD